MGLRAPSVRAVRGSLLVTAFAALLGSATACKTSASKGSTSSDDGSLGTVAVVHVSGTGSRMDLEVGKKVAKGQKLRTDEKTRAKIDLARGVSLVLDRGTEVVLGDDPLHVELASGALSVEVGESKESATSPFTVKTPRGTVTQKGGRVVLTSFDRRLEVDVARGEAVLKDPTGRDVDLFAGHEATVFPDDRVEVVPALDLARRASFVEGLGPAIADRATKDGDGSLSGVGELRAKKPGRKDEKDHAVRLARHDLKVRIVGNVARTEVEEVFANDTDDELEGLWRFPLPAGAEIERLALEVDGKLVEGSFVDKAKAAAIWRGVIQNAAPKAPKPKEEIFWVPGPWRDPALLEWQRGGRFELKIFPIPKRGSRRLVLAYTQTLDLVAGQRRYVYPFPESVASELTVDDVRVDVQVLGVETSGKARLGGYDVGEASVSPTGAQRFEKSFSRFTPSGPLTVSFPSGDRKSDVSAWAYRDAKGDAFAAIALRPKLPKWQDVAARDHVLVLDAGRGMYGERFQRARRLAVKIVSELDRRDRVAVLACDLACKKLRGDFLYGGAAAAHDVEAFLSSIEPDGASDLVGAVRTAGAVSGREEAHELRVTVLSTGSAGAGYRRADRVTANVAAAMPNGKARVNVVPIGADADVDFLSEVATGGGGVVVPYVPGESVDAVAWEVLGASYGGALRDVEVTLPDALVDVAPAVLSPIRAGSESLVVARVRGERVVGDVVLRGKVGGEAFEARYPIDVRPSDAEGNAFVPRLFAAGRIADRQRVAGDESKKELVELSSRFAVPSKFTSLLVLESEAMFQAFGIDRKRTASGWTGESDSEAAEVPTQAPKDDTGATGTLGGLSDPLRAGFLAEGDTATADKRATGEVFDLGHGAGSSAMPPPPVRPAMPAPKAASAADEPSRGRRDEAFDPFAPEPDRSRRAPNPVRPDVAKRRLPPPDDGGRWMKREWYREADVVPQTGPRVPYETLAKARAELLAFPDERKKHVELVRLLAQNGNVDDLEDAVTAWSRRDPLDDGAVTARADVLARRGDRDAALRVLSGVLASPTLPPQEVATIATNLATAFERAGAEKEACALRIAALEAKPKDETALAAAALCERKTGHARAAEGLLVNPAPGISRESVARKVAALDVAESSKSERATGDVVVDASWDGDADLDVTVVDPQGNRIAWTSRAKGVRVADPRSRRHEVLGFPATVAGAYAIELTRTGDGSRASRGVVRITAFGSTKSQDFVLTGTRTSVGAAIVKWKSRMVPADPMDFPRPRFVE
ncbi:MAG: VIT domain-containing protein [Polyangiaceae bacterium]